MNNYQNITIFCLFCIVFSVYGQDEGYGEIIGNPDDTSKIERPCKTYDLNCIRVFFQKHGRCKKTFGPVPNTVDRPQSNINVPGENATLSIVDEKNIGINNGRIEEFYINRETDRLVLAVEFRNFSQVTDKLYTIYHRRTREPVVTESAFSVTYDPLIITAVIPKIDDLRLDDAECTTFIAGQTPRLVLSPTIVSSTDPAQAAAVAQFFTNLPQALQEFFLTDSTFIIATYIQYNICDFGLLLT